MSKMGSVLIVEDDSINAFITKKFISEHHESDVASDGTIALQKIKEKNYDIVLMDINLGDEELDGVEVLRRIRSIPGFEKIPSIAITAYALSNDRERFLAQGFNQYLAKPINKEELLREMEALLKPVV